MTVSSTDISATFSGKAQQLLNRLRTSAGIPLIFAAAVSAAVIVGLVLWASTPDYSVLYSNISAQDGGSIINRLSQMNVPYRLEETSGDILVPASQAGEVRLKLARSEEQHV